MLPELPAASYSVWVRGYGLVDSTPVAAEAGATRVTLARRPRGRRRKRRRSIPGDYWLSLLEPPAKSEFPGHRPQGQRPRPGMLTQNHWINSLKSDCNFCHQLGNQLTRSVDHVFKAKPELKTHAEALGVAARHRRARQRDVRRADQPGQDRGAEGRTPTGPSASPRARCRRRRRGRRASSATSCVTLWDWGTDHSFMHDEVATDKNQPDGQRRRADLRGLGRPRRADDPRSQDEHAPRRSKSRRARRARRCRRASRRRIGRRSGGATSICGPTRRTTRPIRTTRCSTARAACG